MSGYRMALSALVLSFAALGLSSPAHAQCGGSGTTGYWANTFWTWYTAGGNNGNDCIYVTNPLEASAGWDVGDSGGQGDAVGGIGWESGWNSGTINYNFYQGTWSTSDANSGWIYFGLYGWSCGAGGGDQEYYIVQSYNAKPVQGDFIPLGSYRDASGVWYDTYVLPNINRPKYCPGSGSFSQYWAIRQSSAGYGPAKIDLTAAMDYWSANNRGFNRYGVGNGYQVVGPEGTYYSRTYTNMRWSVSR